MDSPRHKHKDVGRGREGPLTQSGSVGLTRSHRQRSKKVVGLTHSRTWPSRRPASRSFTSNAGRHLHPASMTFLSQMNPPSELVPDPDVSLRESYIFTNENLIDLGKTLVVRREKGEVLGIMTSTSTNGRHRRSKKCQSNRSSSVRYTSL